MIMYTVGVLPQSGVPFRTSIAEHTMTGFMPRPCVPPGKKRSGERSRISWAYYPKVVMANEIPDDQLKLTHAWQLTPCRYRPLTGGCPQAVQISITTVVEGAPGKGHA